MPKASNRRLPTLPLTPYRGGEFGGQAPAGRLPTLPRTPYRGGKFGGQPAVGGLPTLPLAPASGTEFGYKNGGLVKMTPKSKKFTPGST